MLLIVKVTITLDKVKHYYASVRFNLKLVNAIKFLTANILQNKSFFLLLKR